MRKFLAFDIEITKILERGADWPGHRPLGISVAAALLYDDPETKIWYGQGRPTGVPWDSMPKPQVRIMVQYLRHMVERGYTLLTWNGLHFDLNVLAEESGMVEECRALAMDMVDPMFHFYWMHGYPVGMQAVADAMGLPGKSGKGADAPIKWADGLYQEVMDYCAQDVDVLLRVGEAIERLGYLYWYTRKNKLKRWNIEEGRLLTVREVLQIPGKAKPWLPVEQFTNWLQGGTYDALPNFL